jgi:1,4-dihydroxy-2-naphthoyl-CoA hydrolase
MFTRKIRLRLFETDATGVLYFAQQLRMAQEAFEWFLESASSSLGKWLKEDKYLLPIVHAEADFLRPLRVGDEIEICLALEHLGNSSFTLSSSFFLEEEVLAGKTRIVHVVIDRGTWQSTPIPPELIQCLHVLQRPQEQPIL